MHLEYIELLGEIFNTDLEMERIKSKLAVALGDDEGISNVLVWKRLSKTQEKLDSKLVLEQHPEEYGSCLDDIQEKTTPEKINIAIDVEPYREYVL